MGYLTAGPPATSVTAASIAAALGFTPKDVSASNIETALGFTPKQVNAANINTALGYTPLNVSDLTEVDTNDIVTQARSGLATKLEAGLAPSMLGTFGIPKITKRPDLNIGSRTVVGLNNIYTPCIVRVPDAVRTAFPAYGKWRCYTSTDHDNGDGGIAIGVSTNDDPRVTSAWTWLRNAGSAKMFFDGAGKQTETPWVMWVPEQNRFYMYYQKLISGTTQGTFLATSADGVTNWTIVGQVLKNFDSGVEAWNHTGYAKVWRWNGKWFAYSLSGSGSQSTHRSATWWSHDGINWIQDQRGMGTAAESTDGVLQLGISSVFEFRSQIWACVSGTQPASGSNTSNIQKVGFAPLNPADDFRSFLGQPQWIEWELVGAETTLAAGPQAWAPMDDGTLVGALRTNGSSGFLSLAVLFA